MEEQGSPKRSKEVRHQKSYFEVLGLCCPSEVPLIENILSSLDGIQKVSVIVPSKMVIVIHDNLMISQLQIVGGAVALEDYTEAGFIVLLFAVATWLESIASLKATAGMSTLMRMAPQKAILAETGEVVDAQDVKINTILAVKAGEVIPIDGVVVEGQSEVDESSLTGESFPVVKQPQSPVWAGTLNIDGYISVRTTALAEQSAVARMARLVEEAQNRRSKTQTLIDSCAKYYTPAVVTIASGVAVVPTLMRVPDTKRWFRLALVLLVSACPCALVLSTPVATFCALLRAARAGLFIKGGDVLENLAGITVVAFDKTGTLTKGEFTVMDFRSISSNLGHAIEIIHAELLPEDKVRLVGDLKAGEGSVAMIGDGMNDAASLAMADVGISMGISGSAVAKETSHITLMSNDISKVPKAIRLARKTYFTIIQNIFFSVMTKVAVLAFAFAGHPLLWAAVLADVGTCLVVILNSMMLLRSKKDKNKNHCARHEHKLPGSHEQSQGCKHGHSCHEHEKGEKEKTHEKCMNQDSRIESSTAAHCCHESVADKANAKQEHSISITDGKVEHGDGLLKENNTSKNVACSHKPDMRESCCESHVICSSSKFCRGTDKEKHGECCITHRHVCGKEQQGCSSSSSQGTIERRMINGCCNSYRKRCGKKDSCCANGNVLLLPEIILE
ncbi:hypothetical protein BHE74_00048473 [Ensete ventricosum]|nr:hypothetical protein BHE74_00048473 [Ensete ventricosum]